MTQQPAKLGFNTRALHVGTSIDPHTGSLQTPIHQTACYNFSSVDSAADLFALKAFGNIYSRLTNPTVSALADRLASLHGGIGATVTASGHSAEILTMFALMQTGDNLVMSDHLYGGTINIARNTMPRFSWNSKIANLHDLGSFEKAIDDRTRGIFIESFANPKNEPADIEGIAKIAQRHRIPLIVDNTLATPYLVRPLELGADIVIESLTKAITGNSSVIGGAIIQGGKFDWSNPKFKNLSQPLPDYNNIVLSSVFGPMAFTVFNIAVGLRDVGPALSAHTAWLVMLGSESMGPRMERHVANGLAFAKHLQQHPQVSWVSYSSLPNSPHYALSKKLSPKGAPPLFSFGLKGGYKAGRTFVENTKIFRHVAQIGDSRSLIVHPASTTHSQVPAERRAAMGAPDDALRVWIGMEDIEDIIADFEQALKIALA